MRVDRRSRVLFLCTGNSCRSQMAEGWARELFPNSIDACSAGTRPAGLNRLAVIAMQEVGIDISRHTSKTVDACSPEALDLVITVCGHAQEQCPVFPGSARVIHHGFEDPPELARGAESDEQALVHYRRVRDEIRTFVNTLPQLVQAARSEAATGGAS